MAKHDNADHVKQEKEDQKRRDSMRNSQLVPQKRMAWDISSYLGEHKSPTQTHKTAIPNQANFSQPERLQPVDTISLNGIIGNRAIARMMAEREEKDEEKVPGPRIQRLLSPADVISLNGIIGNRAVARLMAKREEEEEEKVPGPRMKALREDAVQRQGEAELRSAPLQRGIKMTIGKVKSLASLDPAIHLDSKGMYGWDMLVQKHHIADVLNYLLTNKASSVKGKTINIYSRNSWHYSTRKGVRNHSRLNR